MRLIKTFGCICVLLTFTTASAWAAKDDGAAIQDAASALFPPVQTATHQLAAVRAAHDQLARLGNALLYASVSAADLQAHLPGPIRTQAQDLGAAGEIKPVRIELRDQEAVLTAGFDIEIDTLPANLQGTAEVHCAAAVERGALVLRPSVSTLKLTGGNLGGTDVETAKPFLNLILRALLERLNAAIAVQRVPLRLQSIQHLDLAALLARVGGEGQIASQGIDLNVGLGAAALLVDASGIHVLADAVVLTPERFTATLEELRRDFEQNRPPLFTSNQLAVLGECGQPVVLPQSTAQVFAAVCAANSDLLTTSAPPPTVTDAEAESALAQEVQALRDEFRTRVSRVEPVANLPWDHTLVAVSRAQLAVGLNEVLRGVAVQAKLRPPHVTAEIPPEDRNLRTPPAPDLHCEQVGGACPSVFEYPPYNPRGCDSDCGFNLGCIARKLDCERLKEQERVAYEGAKAAAQAAFGADKARCELVKAGQQIGCRANQAWLNGVGGLDVGELRGGIELRNLEVDLNLDQVHFGPDFEAVELRFAGSGTGDVAAEVTVVPHGAGNLVCVAQWTATLDAHLILLPLQQTVQLQRAGVASQGDQLRLFYRLPEVPLQLHLDPPPVKALLDQNAGKFALSCPLPAATLAVLAGFPGSGIVFAPVLSREILRDVVDVTAPAQEIPVSIGPQDLPVGDGKTVRLVPSWGERAIILKAK